MYKVSRKLSWFTKPCKRGVDCTLVSCKFLHPEPASSSYATERSTRGTEESWEKRQQDEARETVIKKLQCQLESKDLEIKNLKHCFEVVHQVSKSQDKQITEMLAAAKKDESESEEERKSKRAASESGSELSPEDSDDEEEAAPSDYERGEPVKIGRDSASGEEKVGAKKKGGAKGRKKRAGDSSDEGDSDYEKPKAKKKKAGGGGGKNGYTAPVKLSENLADIVGGDEMSRHDVVRRMWAYIKENKLQDQKKKMFVKCDNKLSKVIPKNKFLGLSMLKYLSAHMNVE